MDVAAIGWSSLSFECGKIGAGSSADEDIISGDADVPERRVRSRSRIDRSANLTIGRVTETTRTGIRRR